MPFNTLPDDWQPSRKEIDNTTKAFEVVSAEMTGHAQRISPDWAVAHLKTEARTKTLTHVLGLTDDEANYCEMFMRELKDDQDSVDMRELADYAKSFIFNEPPEAPAKQSDDPRFQDTMKSLYGKLKRFL